MTTDITIIIPTYNERDNIYPVYEHIRNALTDLSWEIVFIDDDSPDNTVSAIREIAKKDKNVRCIQRLDRKGLSSACIEGILASTSPVICIMDADLQHDEKIIPDMYTMLQKGDLDLVIGSRYMDEGSTGTMPEHRVWISKLATSIGKLVLKQPVSDPMSGFFVIRRKFFEQVMRSLSGRGFKILLDILISTGSEIKLGECPYTMRNRNQGESKLSAGVTWEFFLLILEKSYGRIFPRRFVLYGMVGLSGTLLHLFVLWLMHKILIYNFILSQATATYIAMTSNYVLNNNFTFHDRKLSGLNFFKGLASFYIACTFGAMINLSVATAMFNYSLPWWFSGMMGAIAGAVWNYSTNITFTWKAKT